MSTFRLWLFSHVGMLIGGSYGLAMGLYKGGATRRLMMNSLLNSCATNGPFLANQCAAISTFHHLWFHHYLFSNVLLWIQQSDWPYKWIRGAHQRTHIRSSCWGSIQNWWKLESKSHIQSSIGRWFIILLIHNLTYWYSSSSNLLGFSNFFGS